MLTEMMLVKFCYVEHAGSRARDASCGAQVLVSAVGDKKIPTAPRVSRWSAGIHCLTQVMSGWVSQFLLAVFFFGSGLMHSFYQTIRHDLSPFS